MRRIIQESNANQETKNKINKQIYLVEELANCPVCHNKSSHFNSGKTGFIAECSNCNCKCSMDGKTYKQFIKDADKSFEVTGRFFIQFNY